MNKPLSTIGRAENVSFPKLGLINVPARIDTGARTSTIWASKIKQLDDVVEFVLFDQGSPLYTGEVMHTKSYKQRIVTSSNGAEEERYLVKLIVELDGRKINATFTLANRSSQTYPVLVGRNVLRGKFIVDVKLGQPLIAAEKERIRILQNKLGSE